MGSDPPPGERNWLGRLTRGLGSAGFRGAFAGIVFVAAVLALHQTMRGASLAGIGRTILAVRPVTLALVGAASLGSYLCLAISEWWAVRTVGSRLAKSRVAVATFVAYAMSNALGFSLATGGAARLRLYSAWRIGPAEIAAITALAGLAVTFSGLVAAGSSLIVAPAMPLQLRLFGIALLVPVGLWLWRLPSRVWFLPGVELTTLPLTQRVLVLLGGLLDWALSGFALFILLPGAAAHDFLPFLAIFVLGSVVSAMSGVPSGLGVFDAVVLALSRQFSMVHETAAALIVYRLVYDIGPLLIVALGLAAQQGLKLRTRTPAAGAYKVTPAVRPRSLRHD